VGRNNKKTLIWYTKFFQALESGTTETRVMSTTMINDMWMQKLLLVLFKLLNEQILFGKTMNKIELKCSSK